MEASIHEGLPVNMPCGSLKRDFIERVYIPKGPPKPNSIQETLPVNMPLAWI